MPNSNSADDEIKAQQRASRQMLRDSVTGGEPTNVPGAYHRSSASRDSASKDRDYVVHKYVLEAGSSEDDVSVSGHFPDDDDPMKPMSSRSRESMNNGKVKRESALTPGSVRVSAGGSSISQVEAKAARASTNANRARTQSFDSADHDDLAKDVPNTRRISSQERPPPTSSNRQTSSATFDTPAAPLERSRVTYQDHQSSNVHDPENPRTTSNNNNSQESAPNDSSQIAAQLIDEEHEQQRIKNTLENVLGRQNAVQIVDVEAEDRLKRKRQRRNLCLYTLLAAAVLGGVVAAVFVTSKQKLTFAPTMSPSQSPTMAPTTRQDAVMEAVVAQFGELPQDENTPQYRAIQWLTEKDTTTAFPLESEEAEYTFLERYVAAVFAYTTQYWYWVNNDNWLNPDVPVCDGWYGLTCNDDGRIGVLDLAVQNLDGPIPSEIGYLDNLDFVFLFRNKLRGPIPPEVGNLGDVDFMYLNENMLTGQIPNELSGLLDADELFLFGNQLTGTIPDAFGGLVDMVNLYMHDNMLSGEIPSSLSKLKRLQRLYLHDNNLQGTIPPQLGGIISLQRIQLQNNKLTGTIPKEFGGFLGLSVLKLEGNNLRGEMPKEVCALRDVGPIDNLEILETDCLDPALMVNCTCCSFCW